MSSETYLLEGAERGEDGTADPNAVLPLRRSNHLNLHAARGEGRDLLAHSIGNAGEHSRPSAKHDVAVKILSDVHVALHDGIVCGLVYPGILKAD